MAVLKAFGVENRGSVVEGCPNDEAVPNKRKNILGSSVPILYNCYMNEPRTLKDAVVYFSDPDDCLNYLVKRRWPKGVLCPTCGSGKVSFVAKRRVWQCKTRHPKCQFSVKVGTIFEDSALGLDKWLPTVWMITNCKNGISSWGIHRAIGVTQKTAWFMLHRIRLAMQSQRGRLGGNVEVDETFLGGKSRNMHKNKRGKDSWRWWG